jgi:hypothetical protein
MSKSAAQRAKEKIENAYLVQKMREWQRQNGLPDAAPEEPACPKHNWGFSAPPKPKPRASQCPRCIEEARHSHANDEPRPFYEVAHPLNTGETARLAVKFAEFEERKREERERENRPSTSPPEPGSAAEIAALDRIDELRELERERDQRKTRRGGVLVSSRIEGAEVVEYRAVRIGNTKRTRIVRFAP